MSVSSHRQPMGEFLRRLRYFLGQRRHEEDLAEEIALHRDMKARELERDGLSSADAALAARRALGNELASRQKARDVWVWPWLQDMTQDARFALRLLVRERGFAITALLVLGLGIGINNMMFTLVYAHTLRGLPIERPDRVLYISTVDEQGADRGLSYPEFQDLQSAMGSFAGIAAFFNAPVTIGDDGRAPDRFEATYLSGDAFTLLGVQPALGRSFAPEDDRTGAAPVVVLGTGAWQSRYAGDRSIVGRSILVNGAPATVIGVMPPRAGFPSTAEVWLPLAQIPGLASQTRETRTLRLLGLLADSATIGNARAEFEATSERLFREFAQTNQRLRARVVPINEQYLGQLRDPAWLAFTAAGFLVLVISCANVANLMLARAVHRGREIAIRTSLGATRRRVIRQLLIESAVLAGLGGTLGLGISILGVRLFGMGIPANALPYWIDYGMDARVFAALAAVAIATVFLFGLTPAVQASKTDVNRTLKAGGRTSTADRGAHRWTSVFLTAQFALTVILLSYVVLDLRTSQPDLPSDTVVDTSDVLTASITLPATPYRTAEQRWDFYHRLTERLGSLSAISAVSIASALPRRGATEQRLDVEGQSRGAGEAAPPVWTVAIGPRYFATLGLPLERGREFTDRDGGAGQEHAVVNQRFVEMFFPQEDPVGRRIRLAAPGAVDVASLWVTIIGVSQSVRQRGSPTPDPIAYLPLRGSPPPTASLLIRSRPAERASIAALLREELRGLDPHLPFYRVLTMDAVIEEVQWVGRISSNLVRALTFIALALAVVGLYAVTAHAVGQRTQEIGLRIALGARPAHVQRLILTRAARQVAVGLIFGIGCTIAWDAAFFSGRADRKFMDPDVLLPVALLLALVAIAAAVLPARRAMRLDPTVALRQE